MRRAIRYSLAAILTWLVLDALFFRTGLYFPYLEPNSSAGQLEGYLYWLRQKSSVPESLVLGDSRIAHGLSAANATEATGNRLHFWNLGIMGTLPRDWYYLLRDADPTHRRFAAIILALDQYSDEDYVDLYADRIIDLNFLIARLRLTDCWEFATSMRSRENQSRALAGCLIKGIPLRSDIADLLTTWPARFARAKDWRDHGIDAINHFPGIDCDVRGLTADWSRRVLSFPSGLDEPSRITIQATVMPNWPPYSGETTRYRLRWLSKIFDLYRDSPTRVILLELPRAPLPKPDSSTPAYALQGLLPRYQVTALPSSTFRDLERPEYFFDGLHLNRAGRAIFSARLAQLVVRLQSQ
jgi:hypothetical protein